MFITGTLLAVMVVQGLRQICSMIEYYINIHNSWNARSEIKEETKKKNSKIKMLLVDFAEIQPSLEDEDLVLKAYDSNNNHIANINVTSPAGTGIRVGETMFI